MCMLRRSKIHQQTEMAKSGHNRPLGKPHVETRKLPTKDTHRDPLNCHGVHALWWDFSDVICSKRLEHWKRHQCAIKVIHCNKPNSARPKTNKSARVWLSRDTDMDAHAWLLWPTNGLCILFPRLECCLHYTCNCPKKEWERMTDRKSHGRADS